MAALDTVDEAALTADSTDITADGARVRGWSGNSAGYVRHDADDYAEAMAALLPVGPAWPRDPDAALMALVAGLSEIWEGVDGKAASLLGSETDPRSTTKLFPEFERAFGLPDPCLSTLLSLADRRAALLNRMNTVGGQSPSYFVGVAAKLGYQIEIREFSPFTFGFSRLGDTRPYVGSVDWFRLGSDRFGVDPHLSLPSDLVITGDYPQRIAPPSERFVWIVQVTNTRATWFRFGSSEFGIDHMLRLSPDPDWFRLGDDGGQFGVSHHLEIDRAEDLECIIRRLKPAHTAVIFSYG